jgi:hypothetical protein
MIVHLEVTLLSIDPATRRVVQRLGHLYLVSSLLLVVVRTCCCSCSKLY